MQRIERIVHVDRPLTRVWEYLSDFTSTNDWDPGTVRTERRSGDGGLGTVYHNVSKFLGRETEVIYTVIDIEPHHLLRLRGENKSLTATDTLTFEGDETATTVTYVAEFEFRKVAKLVDPLMAFPLKKLGDDAVKEMQKSLEAL